MWRIGTSGWHYRHWWGVVYPRECRLPLPEYAKRFDTVEINNSFYRLPERATFARWREQTPPGFLFAVKMSRFLTHLRRLWEPEEPIVRFADRVVGLGDKLGPVLFQLPPRFSPDVARLARVLELAPWRVAVELRDPAWYRDDVYAVLRAHKAALVLTDATPIVVTASFSYIRFHVRTYDDRALDAWAARMKDLPEGYAYFNNDAEGNAFRDAARLRERLALPTPALADS